LIAPAALYTNPRFAVEKLPIFGKIDGICAVLTPNQDASVAAYCTLPVEGTHRPFVPESSGPFSASVGNVPYIWPPFTAPPITIWCDPHAWSLPVFEFGWNVRLKSDIVNVVTLFCTPISTVAA
jgi:hypothetical protein